MYIDKETSYAMLKMLEKIEEQFWHFNWDILSKENYEELGKTRYYCEQISNTLKEIKFKEKLERKQNDS